MNMDRIRNIGCQSAFIYLQYSILIPVHGKNYWYEQGPVE